jgi:hypothetical protein
MWSSKVKNSSWSEWRQEAKETALISEKEKEEEKKPDAKKMEETVLHAFAWTQ